MMPAARTSLRWPRSAWRRFFYFAYVSYFVLKTACVLCMGTYVSVIAIFITSGTATSMKMSSLPGRFLRDLRALFVDPLRMVATLLFVAAAVSMMACFPKEGQSAGRDRQPAASGTRVQRRGDNVQKRFEDAWAQQPRVDLGIPADGAQVVVVKFNDWQCPSCKAAYYAYKPVLDKYQQVVARPREVRHEGLPAQQQVQLQHSPGQNHPAACEAAAAVRLARARRQGGRDGHLAVREPGRR